MLIISAISGDGNTKQVDEIRAKGIPVVDLVNGINTQVDGKSLESWYLLGYMGCQWAAEQHPAGSGKKSLAWFPGPPGAGWSVAGDQGCNAARQYKPKSRPNGGLQMLMRTNLPVLAVAPSVGRMNGITRLRCRLLNMCL